MSAGESDRAEDPPPFVETDDRETKLGYDNGGVPFYVALAWVGFIITYIVVMSLIALPDLRRWLAH